MYTHILNIAALPCTFTISSIPSSIWHHLAWYYDSTELPSDHVSVSGIFHGPRTTQWEPAPGHNPQAATWAPLEQPLSMTLSNGISTGKQVFCLQYNLHLSSLYNSYIYIYICILILATSCNKGEVIRCLSIRGVLPLSPPRPSDILWSSARLRLGPKDPCHLCLGCWNHLQVHSTEVSSLAEIKDVD